SASWWQIPSHRSKEDQSRLSRLSSRDDGTSGEARALGSECPSVIEEAVSPHGDVLGLISLALRLCRQAGWFGLEPIGLTRDLPSLNVEAKSLTPEGKSLTDEVV